MAAFLLRRFAYGVVTVLGVLLLLFVLFFAVTDPDDIARKAVGERARPEVYQQWKKNHGYDRPLFFNSAHAGGDLARYTDTLLFEHFRSMLTFDFGRSDADDSPIGTRLLRGAGPSLSLTVPLFLIELVVAVAIGLMVAFFRETAIDRVVLVACIFTMSVATLLYIIAGSSRRHLLKWFPISGFSGDSSVVWRFLALPVLVGVVSGFGSDVRLYRTIFVEEMGRDYVRTARAKGCRRCARHGGPCAAERRDPDHHQCGRGHPFPLHRLAAAGKLLRYPGPRRHDRGGHPGQRFRDPACDGVPGRPALHPGTDPHRRELRARRSQGAAVMSTLSNLLVVVLLLGAAWIARTASRDRYWRETAREMWRRRPFAIVVIALYLLVGLADSISWVGGAVEGDPMSAFRARSLIDRAFQPETFKEASYSAPFAKTAFYGAAPLKHPGAHWLGTDILGRDVVYRALKGIRVALLIGGLTTLVVIPIALVFGVSAGYFGRKVDDAVFFVMTVLSSVRRCCC